MFKSYKKLKEENRKLKEENEKLRLEKLLRCFDGDTPVTLNWKGSIISNMYVIDILYDPLYRFLLNRGVKKVNLKNNVLHIELYNCDYKYKLCIDGTIRKFYGSD